MTAGRRCPDRATLEKFLVNLLDPQESRAVENHLQECDACLTLFEATCDLGTVIDALRNPLSQERQGDPPAISKLIEQITEMWPSYVEGLPGEQGRPLLEKTHPEPVTRAVETGIRFTPAAPEAAGEELAPPEGPGEIGRLGDYRVLELLGQGGMGAVYLAEDCKLGRRVALKTIHPRLASDPIARERFLREARLAAALEHDHIVPIFQVGEDRGVPFIAMPLLKGQSLGSRLEGQRRLPPADAVRIARETAEALACAHAAGLIHRDIKPANLWLEARSSPKAPGASASPSPLPRKGEESFPSPLSPYGGRGAGGEGGRVKVLDFGLARPVEGGEALTEWGTVLGTPGYMAPEQADGGAVDGRADLFSLGVLLYRMLTGEQPYRARSMLNYVESLVKDQPQPPAALVPEVPATLSSLVMRLLARNPANRPASAEAVAGELTEMERELGHPPAERHPSDESATEALPPLVRRRRSRVPWAVAVLVPLFLAAVVGILILLSFSNNPTSAKIAATTGEGDKPPTSAAKPPPRTQPAPGKQFVRSGRPLNPYALVLRPPLLPGVRTWTLETIRPRGGWFGDKRHFDETGFVALHPDGHRLAVVGLDATIRIYDVKSGRLEKALIDETENAGTCSWSPDGKVLLSNRRYGWDVAAGRLRYALPAGQDVVAWSPDGKQLASLSDALYFWDAQTGRLLHRQTHPAPGGFCGNNTLIWSRKGRLLAFRSGDRIVLWDVVARKIVKERPCKGLLSGMLWARDEHSLAIQPAVSPGGVWDVDSGKLTEWKEPGSLHFGQARSPDGMLPVAREKSLWLWDAVTEQATEKVRGVEGLFYSWARDGKQVAFGDFSCRDAVLDATSGHVLFKVEHLPRISLSTWSPDSRRIVTQCGYDPYSLRSWDLEMGKGGAAQLGCCSPAYSPDGATLAVLSHAEGRVRLFDARIMVRRTELAAPIGLTAREQVLCWSPDGKRLAAGNTQGGVRVWDSESGRSIRELTNGKLVVTALAWSPEGKKLAVARSAQQPSLDIWEIAADRRTPTTSIPFNAYAPYDIRWSPDASFLAMRSWATGLQVLDLPSGNLCATSAGLVSGRWLPGGTLRALGSDGAIADFERPESDPTGLARISPPGDTGELSPDGRRVAVLMPSRGEGSSTLGFRKTSNGEPTGVLVDFDRDRWLAISPDGHFRCSPGVEDELVYIIQTDDGRQETLHPAEFAERFGWKNDPSKVHPLGGDLDRYDIESFPAPPKASVLCDGSSLDAWRAGSGAKLTGDGALTPGADDLISKERYGGRFKLHLEFRLPTRADVMKPSPLRGGVLVQGRYLMHIADSHGVAPATDSCGAIAGVRAPALRASRLAGTWQSLEVELEPPISDGGKVKEPAKLSAWLNDFLIHDRVPVDPTNRAYDLKVTEPGPMALIGDEGIQFRNVWVLALPGKE
jgi:serine/threonine protein kinase/WD40 repeat protein